jgi:hypothetical protein
LSKPVDISKGNSPLATMYSILAQSTINFTFSLDYNIISYLLFTWFEPTTEDLSHSPHSPVLVESGDRLQAPFLTEKEVGENNDCIDPELVEGTSLSTIPPTSEIPIMAGPIDSKDIAEIQPARYLLMLQIPDEDAVTKLQEYDLAGKDPDAAFQVSTHLVDPMVKVEVTWRRCSFHNLSTMDSVELQQPRNTNT